MVFGGLSLYVVSCDSWKQEKKREKKEGSEQSQCC
jgi:hypothetical protein